MAEETNGDDRARKAGSKRKRKKTTRTRADAGGTAEARAAAEARRPEAEAERAATAEEARKQEAGEAARKQAAAEAQKDDAAAGSNAGEATSGEREAARKSLSDQFRMFTALAGMVAKRGAVKTTKAAMPLMHGYVGSEAQVEKDDNGEPIKSPGRLTENERLTLNRFGEKLAFESIELASLAYPTVEGIEPYRAVRDDNGRYPAPHLGQILSLGAALQRFLADDDADGNAPPDGGQDGQAEFLADKERILLTAVTADEYGYLNMPVPPRTIRRVALNERERMLMNQPGGMRSTTMQVRSGSMQQPRSNMMTNQGNAMTTNAYSGSAVRYPAAAPQTAGYNTMTGGQTSMNASCPGCGSSVAAPVTTAARYNPDGTCMDTMSISCETNWRMRDCLKLALCEFLTCVADEFCVDGRFQRPTKDIGEILMCCLGDAMCTTMRCLPEAICGPRQEETCVPPPPALGCNFAVEEKR